MGRKSDLKWKTINRKRLKKSLKNKSRNLARKFGDHPKNARIEYQIFSLENQSKKL